MCTHLLYYAFGEDSTGNAHDGTKLRAKHSKKLSNSRYRQSPIQIAGSRRVHYCYTLLTLLIFNVLKPQHCRHRQIVGVGPKVV